MGNLSKNIRPKLPPSNWNINERNIEEHKGNMRERQGSFLQHVFSIYNSHRRSEECSSVGRQLLLCKNNSKLAASRKVKLFLEVWEILTKEPEMLEIVKGFKTLFLRNPAQEKVPQTPHMGQEQAGLIRVVALNHSYR